MEPEAMAILEGWLSGGTFGRDPTTMDGIGAMGPLINVQHVSVSETQRRSDEPTQPRPVPAAGPPKMAVLVFTALAIWWIFQQ